LPFKLHTNGGETNVAKLNSEIQVVSLKVNKINYLILSLGQPNISWLGTVSLSVTYLNLFLEQDMKPSKCS